MFLTWSPVSLPSFLLLFQAFIYFQSSMCYFHRRNRWTPYPINSLPIFWLSHYVLTSHPSLHTRLQPRYFGRVIFSSTVSIGLDRIYRGLTGFISRNFIIFGSRKPNFSTQRKECQLCNKNSGYFATSSRTAWPCECKPSSGVSSFPK